MSANEVVALSRRSFLGGALAVAGATMLPAIPAFARGPVIVGDGIHDDTAGLQAAFDGLPFRVEGRTYVVGKEGHVYVAGGKFKISETLIVRKNVTISDCVFDASGSDLRYLLRFGPLDYASLKNVTFQAAA